MTLILAQVVILFIAVIGIASACNFRMLYCMGIPTGNNSLACDINAKFPVTLSVPDGQCWPVNGTVRGMKFGSIRGEFQHRGFAFAKYYVDATCHTSVHVDRFSDNTCFTHPGVSVQERLSGQRWDYMIAGYCCACGSNANATSCAAKWRIDGMKKCFTGC